MAPPEMLPVTVVVSGCGRQTLRRLDVPAGTTTLQAVDLSGALLEHPELDPGALGLAIYGRVVAPGQPVEAGDRIEVLRPLPHEPRARRRELAREGRSMGTSARVR
jgi:uncharacterized protein